METFPLCLEKICKNLNFSPNIDLFASRLNYQLQPFVSYQPDPQSYATDAFSIIDWAQWDFCAFPFFCDPTCVAKSNY